MISYLLKICALVIFAGGVIFYYFSSGIHTQSFSESYVSYIVTVAIIYVMYKAFSLIGKDTSEKVTFTPIGILGYFLLHLLLLSILFFSYNGEASGLAMGNGIALFFSIGAYALVPGAIVLISLAFGKKILTHILPGYTEKSPNYKCITGLGFGFFSFIFILTIIGMLGAYNMWTIFIMAAIIITWSYKELGKVLYGLWNYTIECTNHNTYSNKITEILNIKLLSAEFFFIIITFFLSVNLISIFRPFPIGWDDLGVYMNYPRIMADNGIIGEISGMLSWQTFTGIGYMFNNSTLAFFLNSVGGFASVIVLTLIVSEIFKKAKSTFIHLPLLAAMLFISMPMIVFQQAKDMKLDSGLFFVSIVALYMLYEHFTSAEEDKKTSKKGVLQLFGVIGLLLGFTFTIKLTSLLLISAVGGMLFYVRGGIVGFLGFIGIYISIFTAGGLWKMMNVTGLDTPELKEKVVLIAGILGIVFLITASIIGKKSLKGFVSKIAVLLLGIILAVAPWGINHITSAIQKGGEVGIMTILGGVPENFKGDYLNIYTEKELATIRERSSQLELQKSGTTTNEDFGRYFGYEKGINNYIKLPWNLTMQVNQKGEFTTVGFLFLALLPALFLFLPFKRKWLSWSIVLLLILEVGLFPSFKNNLIEKEELSQLSNEVKNKYFINNIYIFNDEWGRDDIYDINWENYISEEEISQYMEKFKDKIVADARIKTNEILYKEVTNKINSLKKKNIKYNERKIREEKAGEFKKRNKEVYKEVYKQYRVKVTEAMISNFYKKLQSIVLSIGEKDYKAAPIEKSLSTEDVFYLKRLEEIYKNFYIFKKQDFTQGGIENKSIQSLWEKHRTIKQYATGIMSEIPLPYGYIFIFVFFLLIPLILIEPLLKKRELTNVFKMNLVFTLLYVVLWVISAFGIVWYGITMYFNFILLIVLGIYYLGSYNVEDSKNKVSMRFFGTMVIFSIIGIYIFTSAFPYAFKNLKKASYKDFKIGKQTIAEAPFYFHKEYLPILFELNIKEEERERFLRDIITGPEVYNMLKIQVGLKDILQIQQKLLQIAGDKKFSDEARNSAKKWIQEIYSGISQPEKEYKNLKNIYRVGTFLKYHITKNHIRVLEDALINEFDTYLYDKDKEVTISRMKKANIDYLLVDLNAATIDKAGIHALTTRYEKLLLSFRSKQLELIETDSVCLKIALDDFKHEKDKESYLMLAGVNYISYDKDNKPVQKQAKLAACYMYIVDIFKVGKVNKNRYPYLQAHEEGLASRKTRDEKILYLHRYLGRSFKVLFKIK